MKMNTKLTLLEKGLTYIVRSKSEKLEELKFSSKKPLDIQLGDSSEDFLIKLNSHNGTTFFSLTNTTVIEIIEDEDGFIYRLSAERINWLSKWEFGLVKKQCLKNVKKESNSSS